MEQPRRYIQQQQKATSLSTGGSQEYKSGLLEGQPKAPFDGSRRTQPEYSGAVADPEGVAFRASLAGLDVSMDAVDRAGALVQPAADCSRWQVEVGEVEDVKDSYARFQLDPVHKSMAPAQAEVERLDPGEEQLILRSRRQGRRCGADGLQLGKGEQVGSDQLLARGSRLACHGGVVATDGVVQSAHAEVAHERAIGRSRQRLAAHAASREIGLENLPAASRAADNCRTGERAVEVANQTEAEAIFHVEASAEGDLVGGIEQRGSHKLERVFVVGRLQHEVLIVSRDRVRGRRVAGECHRVYEARK